MFFLIPQYFSHYIFGLSWWLIKSEMRVLEKDFLDLIEFELFVSVEMIEEYKNIFYRDLIGQLIVNHII